METRSKKRARREQNRCRLVILDLDGTFVSTTERPELLRCYHIDYYVRNPAVSRSAPLKSQIMGYTFVRPGTREFIDWLFDASAARHLNTNRVYVAVWSAGTREYVDQIVKLLFSHAQREELVFVWSRDMCETELCGFVHMLTKPLSKVWSRFPSFTASNTAIIDDSPHTYAHNKSCAIPIAPFVDLCCNSCKPKSMIRALPPIDNDDDAVASGLADARSVLQQHSCARADSF